MANATTEELDDTDSDDTESPEIDLTNPKVSPPSGQMDEGEAIFFDEEAAGGA